MLVKNQDKVKDNLTKNEEIKQSKAGKKNGNK
jgi:hypothetical protein